MKCMQHDGEVSDPIYIVHVDKSTCLEKKRIGPFCDHDCVRQWVEKSHEKVALELVKEGV